jgi:hypothetical protein
VTATNASPPPEPPEQPPGGPKTWVFLVNGTRSSAGAGPGPRELPVAEAGALVAAHLAVHGTEPPHGWSGA